MKGPFTRNIHVIYENFISPGLKIMAKVSFLQKQVKVRGEGHEVKNYGTMWRSCHKEYNVKHEQWQSYNQKKSVTDVRKLRQTDGRAGGQIDRLQTQWKGRGNPIRVSMICNPRRGLPSRGWWRTASLPPHKNWWSFLVNKVMIFRIRVFKITKINALLLYFQRRFSCTKHSAMALFIKMINVFFV